MPINKALAEYLDLYHKGEANAVTSRELECAFRMRGSELRREINALRGDGIPICSFDGGYYQNQGSDKRNRSVPFRFCQTSYSRSAGRIRNHSNTNS